MFNPLTGLKAADIFSNDKGSVSYETVKLPLGVIGPCFEYVLENERNSVWSWIMVQGSQQQL